ncbi:hypothetical protein G4B11_010063 [Aspergillus flavus]|nr:hypothetical protein G4B11_010063 [Aspergillus flavus]
MLGASSETEYGLAQSSSNFTDIKQHLGVKWESYKCWVVKHIDAQAEGGCSYTVKSGGWNAIRDYMNWIRARLEHWNLWDEASIESFVQQAGDVLREHSNDSGNDWNYSVDEYWKDRNGQTQDDEEFEEEPDEEPQEQPPKAQNRRTEEFFLGHGTYTSVPSAAVSIGEKYLRGQL